MRGKRERLEDLPDALREQALALADKMWQGVMKGDQSAAHAEEHDEDLLEALREQVLASAAEMWQDVMKGDHSGAQIEERVAQLSGELNQTLLSMVRPQGPQEGLGS